jgi:hypothetical protein
MAASQRAAIFICSSRAPRDRAFARRLANDLRTLGFAPIVNRGRSDAPQPAADIDRAQKVLVVVSPQLAGSAPARIEYMYALEHGKSVVPLQVSSRAAIPPELKDIQWVDFFELYDQGLATLASHLGISAPRLARRAALARVRGRIILVARGVLATLMFAARMLVVFGIVGPWSFVAVLPAIFAEVSEEDYRRGDQITRRIVLAKTLLGAAGGMFAGVLIVSSVAALSATSESAHMRVGDIAGISLLLGVAGAVLGWLLIRLERRNLDQGQLRFSKVMHLVRYCAKASLITAGALTVLILQTPHAHPLLADSVGQFVTSDVVESSSTVLALVAIVVVLAVILAAPLAAPLEWLRSPVHRSRRRAQAADGVAPQTKATPSPGATAGLVFISHSSADNELALRLAADLQTRDIPTWVDRHRLAAGMRWPDEIRQSVDTSSTFMLLLSPVAAASDWVREEYRRALAKGKAVVVVRLDPTCAIPPELNQAPLVEFSALYSKGLLDVLVALGATQSTVAAVARAVRQRIQYAWLIGTARAGALGYMLWARIAIFGIASFALLGGFDRIAGFHSLAEYLPIWLLHAAPGAALGAFVEIGENASIAGAKLTAHIGLAKIANGALLGMALLGPVPLLTVLFFANNSPADVPDDSTKVYVILALLGISLVSGLMALPMARIERRNREQGKAAFVLWMRAARYLSRGFVGSIGLVIPFYLLIDSPENLFGPPPNQVLGGMAFWWLAGLIVGGIMAAVQLFFFPSSLTRKALRQLGSSSEIEAPRRISQPRAVAAAARGRRSDTTRS